MMKKYRPILFFIFVYFVLLIGIVQAKTDGVSSSKTHAKINGFRSAKFGMKEHDVLKAISKDFKTKKNKVSRFKHPTEKTLSLGINVDRLLPNSGPAKVFYVLGHKSRRLIHVKVIWGKPATPEPDAGNVVSTANLLRNHLAQKVYQKEGLVFNKQLSEGVFLVFQGLDKKGHAVKLVLINPKVNPKKMGENISLTLSYIEKPGKPDVFRIKNGDF
jgi:hypothetical protein